MKRAEYGIIYNFLAYRVLKYRLSTTHIVNLIVDAQNTEIHSGRHFNGYVKTTALAENQGLNRFTIDHLDSDKVYGLRAADYFSWAIHRKYEFKDSRFYDMITDKLCNQNCHRWFYK